MPKVRERKEVQEKALEAYANRSHDSIQDKRKKQTRICIGLFEEELEKIKRLAEEDQRSLSSFIRMQLLKMLRDSQ